MNDQLIKLKRKLEDINKEVKLISNEQKALISHYAPVRAYANLDVQKRDLDLAKKEIKKAYTELTQQRCKDPLWYFLSSSSDDNMRQECWTCICFECQKVVTGHPKIFKKCIRVKDPSLHEKEQGDCSFQNLLGKYSKYKSQKPNANVTNNTMIKKYSSKS